MGQREAPPTDVAGSGQRATWGARFVAVFVDWLLANVVAFAIVRDVTIWQAPTTWHDFLPLAIFAVEVWVMTAVFGGSVGHKVRRLAVVRPDGRPVGFLKAAIRTLGVLLIIPPFVVLGEDGRGLHDRLAGTAIGKMPPKTG
jgi:uncharacterized RDD family membrane protein YckC